MKPDIYKTEHIGSGFLAVMAKPVAGEWIDDNFRSIAEFGIQQIVSLLEIQEAREVGLEREKFYAEKHSMKFVSYPICDRDIPLSVVQFKAFTRRLYDDIAGGMNTVIHCRAGIGRTGVVAAGVLLHCGFEPEDAFRQISKKRGVQVPDTEEQFKWIVKNRSLIVSGGT